MRRDTETNVATSKSKGNTGIPDLVSRWPGNGTNVATWKNKGDTRMSNRTKMVAKVRKGNATNVQDSVTVVLARKQRCGTNDEIYLRRGSVGSVGIVVRIGVGEKPEGGEKNGKRILVGHGGRWSSQTNTVCTPRTTDDQQKDGGREISPTIGEEREINVSAAAKRH